MGIIVRFTDLVILKIEDKKKIKDNTKTNSNVINEKKELDSFAKMNVLQLVLFSLLLLSLYCSESQKREKAISDGSGHITTSVSCSGKMDDKTLRRRCFRRRRMVKWCDSRMKAKEIDDEASWNKIVAATVFVLGLVHFLYFFHPVCYRDRPYFPL